MLHKAAYSHAWALIRQGRIDKSSAWSFSAEDGNALLGDPPDWDRYGLFFLLRLYSEDFETKEAYKYPYGKGGKLYRSALAAIRQRAAQQDEREIFEAAGRLLEGIDGKTEARQGFVAEMPQAGAVPSEFQVFPAGTVELQGDEPVIVDREAIADVIRKFDARGVDMVIDFEHQTEGGEWSSPDGTAPAAGWIKRLLDRGEQGLWAVVEWTERARQYLANREYRYFSPVFLTSKKDRRLVELLRVALTNAPRLNWIRPITAKKPAPGGEKEEDVDKLKELLKALGLAEDAGVEQAIAAIAKLKEAPKPVVAKGVASALGLAETATESEIVATIHAIKQRPDLTAEVAALKTRLAERDRDELVAAALKEGKIAPAQKEWAEKYALADPQGFALFLAKAPVVVPVARIAVPENGPDGSVLDETQKQINKQLQISDEVWGKHNKKEG